MNGPSDEAFEVVKKIASQFLIVPDDTSAIRYIAEKIDELTESRVSKERDMIVGLAEIDADNMSISKSYENAVTAQALRFFACKIRYRSEK